MATFEPTSSTGLASVDGLRERNKFTKEFVMDRKPFELFAFPNLLDTGASDNAESMGAGAPEFAEISTASVGGILVATSNDAYGTLLVLPYWCDPSRQIDFRVLWSNSEAAGTGTFGIAVTYTPIDVSTQSTATAIGATALDSTIDSQADLAANVARWTEFGYISANKAGVKDLDPGSDLLSLNFVGTLTTIADASVIQAQCRMYRKFL